MTRTNTQIAVDALGMLEFAGALSADCNHLEGELAAGLDLSHAPSREATLMLKAQGLSKVHPRKGIRIASISEQELNDTYEVLCEPECLSVTNVANAGYTEQDLEHFNRCIENMIGTVA